MHPQVQPAPLRTARSAWGSCAGLLTASLAVAFLACVRSAPVQEEPPAPSGESELTRSLTELGLAALERGDLDLAEGRFRRALRHQPFSIHPQVGLARVALARGDEGGARETLEAVSESVDAVDALLLLAELDVRSGEPGRAFDRLERAARSRPESYVVAHAFAQYTGAAPLEAAATDREILRRALDHPYDPAARLGAGRLFMARSQSAAARVHLESAVWQSDRDPEAGRVAVELLRQVDPRWSAREVVQVHCIADETVRREASWRMRLRWLLRAASETLDPVVGVAFVPASMNEGRTARATASLEEIDRAFRSGWDEPPTPGIIAAFTERPPPPGPGDWRLGQADFLGRHLTVRLEPGERQSRVLIHELLHLYGAAHVAPDVSSLMNPRGLALSLDPLNRAVAGFVRSRRFGPGGVSANVLPYTNVAELTRSYMAMLALNLKLRSLGIEEAVEAKATSRYIARQRALEAVDLDDHLGDVSRFVATLHVYRGDRAAAADLFDLAARLYGVSSRRGREAHERANAIR